MLHCLGRTLVLLFATTFLSVLAFGQNRPVVPVTNYEAAELDFHPQNWQVVRDHRGMVYVANGEGVLEFDGHDWTEIQAHNLSGFLSLDTDSIGRVYCGGISDLGYLSADARGKTQFESLADQLPDSLADFTHVWTTTCVGDRVFYMCRDRLLVFRNHQFEMAIRPHSVFTWSYVLNGSYFLLDGKDGVFAFTPQGLVTVPHTRWMSENSSYATIMHDEDRWLVTTGSSGLFLFDPFDTITEPTPFAVEVTAAFPDVQYYTAVRVSPHVYALGTFADGILLVDDEGHLVDRISSPEGLLSESVNSLYMDDYGLLWGALNNGVTAVQPNHRVARMPEGEGFEGAVNDLIFFDDQLYVATNQGVWRYAAPDWAQQGEAKWEALEGIAALAFQFKTVGDDLLVAANTGVFRIDGLTSERVYADYVRTLVTIPNRDDAVAVFGRKTFVVLEGSGSSWNPTIDLKDLKDEFLSAAQEAGRGDSIIFWAGHFSEGCTRVAVLADLSSVVTTVYDSTHGLNDRWVQVFDFDGRVRFGSDGLGLLRFDESTNRFVADTDWGDLNQTGIFVAKGDASNRTWMDVDGQVWYWSAPGAAADSVRYSTMKIGDVNVILPIDSVDQVWMGGMNGLARVKLNEEHPIAFTTPVLLRRVTIGFDSVLIDGGFAEQGLPVLTLPTDILTLDYALNTITFQVAAPVSTGGEVMFSSRLEPQEVSWGEWTDDPKRQFIQLPEGEYRFQIKARNAYGQESELLEYRFTVLPPWYRTWWAYALYLALGIITLVVARKLREARKVRQQNAYLEKEVAARTEEIREQRDALATQKEIIEAKNNGIMDSIRYAQRIQNAILPPDEYVTELLPNAFVLYLPKDIVSGDFYWLGAHPNTSSSGKVSFAAVDCTGHGVPGAFMSIVGYNLLQQAVKEKGYGQPAEILNFLNQGVMDTLRQTRDESKIKDGMDISLASVDPQAMKLEFAGAKNPLYLIREKGDEVLPQDKDALEAWAAARGFEGKNIRIEEGETHFLLELKGDRHPIGAYIGESLKPFTNRTFDLQKGDSIYLFSDGFADQFGGQHGKKYMYKRFKQLLLKIHQQSPESQRTLLEAEFIAWKGGYKQIDDVCIVGLSV